MENKEKHKVRILFKSGNSILLAVDKFSITKSFNDLTGAEWENAIPSIMFLSLSDIEGIFQEDQAQEQEEK